MLIIWLAEESQYQQVWGVGQVTEGTVEEEDAEQKVKDAVPLIMAN